jgi:hypothetical protein
MNIKLQNLIPDSLINGKDEDIEMIKSKYSKNGAV